MDPNSLTPPPPPPPSDYPTVPPPNYVPPPPPIEGPLGSMRSFVQGTVDPLLGTARDTIGDLIKGALPILQPPAIQAGQGLPGKGILNSTVDMLNPLPRDTSDLLRDLPLALIPGSGGARAAMRVGAGAAGAGIGAELGGKDVLPAVGTSLPGMILGEGVRGLTKNVGRDKRQSAEDAQNVSAALNKAEPDLNLPSNVPGLYQKAFAPKGEGNLMDVTTPRYKAMLDTVEHAMVDPERPLLQLPSGEQATFREAMDFIMNNSSAGQRKGPLSDAPKSARQVAMETIKTRDQVIESLHNSPHPQEQALGDLVQAETKRYFIDRTAARLLRAPGVLNTETGMWNMRAAQEAFHKELAKNMIPADVYADFQAAFYRGASPPKMDLMGEAGGLLKGVMGMGGAMVGSATGHPIMGYHSGLRAANRMVPTDYVGKTVGASPLSQVLGPSVSIGSGQALKELLSGLQ